MLSSSALKVQQIIHDLGFDCRVLELPESTRTAPEAAQAAGCSLGQIVKSLIFKGQSTGKPILALVSGVNRADEAKLADLAGEAIMRADPEFVRTVTGFAIGGVPPVGHVQVIEIYIDPDLLQYQTIWAAAGTPKAIFEVAPQDLVKMTGGRVVSLK